VRGVAEDHALVVNLDVGMMIGIFGAGHERADEQHRLGKILEVNCFLIALPSSAQPSRPLRRSVISSV
jgi:hypothetical protein